jgi:hypothetical protein
MEINIKNATVIDLLTDISHNSFGRMCDWRGDLAQGDPAAEAVFDAAAKEGRLALYCINTIRDHDLDYLRSEWAYIYNKSQRIDKRSLFWDEINKRM